MSIETFFWFFCPKSDGLYVICMMRNTYRLFVIFHCAEKLTIETIGHKRLQKVLFLLPIYKQFIFFATLLVLIDKNTGIISIYNEKLDISIAKLTCILWI